MAAAQEEIGRGSKMLHVLQSTQLQQLVQNKGELVEVNYSNTVKEAMQVMVDHNVMAMPVVAPPGQWIGGGGTLIVEQNLDTGEPRKQYIGIISVFDVLLHICDTRFDPDVASRLTSNMNSVMGHTLEGLTVWTMSPSTSVYEAMEPLSKGVHRVLVPLVSGMEHGPGVELTEFSPGYRMITQTDLVRFLMEQKGAVREFLQSRTVTEAGAVREDIMALPGHLTLLAALKEMGEKNQTAAAILQSVRDGEVLEVTGVVEGKGRRAVCSFSGGDLRGCAPETLSLWSSRPVLEFLRKHEVARRYGVEAAAGDDEAALPSPPLTCSPDATLAEAASKALESQLHRVWVTDDEGLLCGAVHFTDILRIVREHVREQLLHQDTKTSHVA